MINITEHKVYGKDEVITQFGLIRYQWNLTKEELVNIKQDHKEFKMNWNRTEYIQKINPDGSKGYIPTHEDKGARLEIQFTKTKFKEVNGQPGKVTINIEPHELVDIYRVLDGNGSKVEFTRTDKGISFEDQNTHCFINLTSKSGKFYCKLSNFDIMIVKAYIISLLTLEMKEKGIILTEGNIISIIANKGVSQYMNKSSIGKGLEEKREEGENGREDNRGNGIELNNNQYKQDGTIDCNNKGCEKSFNCEQKIIDWCTSEKGKAIYKGFVFCPKCQDKVKSEGIKLT